ncbi:protein obstructor-E-like [Melitaea cinxia]|uniref:protein obstructor-E-like n=1 Tax=Melitaea cinxia TaxID=113334 RepID=UPI001E26F386|nr:protein obstructor-E-like [Melitaea cinxia]
MILNNNNVPLSSAQNLRNVTGSPQYDNERNPVCKLRNAYLVVEGKCDSYIECRDYQPNEMDCPDGLNYNPEAKWPNYACSYPQDVPCEGRKSRQPAKPTANCPRQNGYFKSPLAKENDCGHYRLCSGGEPFEMFCPNGLAFNPDTGRCDWLELVPSCNAEKYVSFKCPPSAVDKSGNAMVTNHKYEGSCNVFYSCMNGHARVLSCDDGFAFDAVKGHCDIEERVNCDARFARSQVF